MEIRLYSNSGESEKISVLSDEVAYVKNHHMNALLPSKDSSTHCKEQGPNVPMFTCCFCIPSSLFITKILTLEQFFCFDLVDGISPGQVLDGL